MQQTRLPEGETTNEVIGAFFEVCNALGFGSLEHVYTMALERVLIGRERLVGREVSVPVWFQGEILTSQRIDLIVDERVVVEVKSSHVLPPTAQRQTLNYLRATRLEVALLLHFGPKPRFYRLVQANRDHRDP